MHKQCELMSAAAVAQLLNVTPGYVAHKLTTWRIDIAVAGGAANTRVHSTRPRIDLGPILVEMTDDIVVVAIKVLEATHDRTV